MDTMTTGERIRALRIRKGMSQEELGSRVGLKKAAINKYETGIVVNLKRSVIAKLAEVLETSPAYLMGWEYDENSTSQDLIDLMSSLSLDDLDQQPEGETRSKNLHFNAKPDPEWLELYEKLKNKTITTEELSLFREMTSQGNENLQKEKKRAMELVRRMMLLNTAGQKEAIKRISELAELPRYQREPSNPPRTTSDDKLF